MPSYQLTPISEEWSRSSRGHCSSRRQSPSTRWSGGAARAGDSILITGLGPIGSLAAMAAQTSAPARSWQWSRIRIGLHGPTSSASIKSCRLAPTWWAWRSISPTVSAWTPPSNAPAPGAGFNTGVGRGQGEGDGRPGGAAHGEGIGRTAMQPALGGSPHRGDVGLSSAGVAHGSAASFRPDDCRSSGSSPARSGSTTSSRRASTSSSIPPAENRRCSSPPPPCDVRDAGAPRSIGSGGCWARAGPPCCGSA